jgi:hypothetical protein
LIIFPHTRKSAVETEWIPIVAINIDRRWLTWRIIPSWMGIVADERHDDACFPILRIYGFHVLRVRKFDSFCGAGVFVFWLQQNDRTTVCDLRFGNDAADLRDITEGSDIENTG